MNKSDKIYIAGHNGLVGSALLRKLKSQGFNNILYRTSSELNLINQQAVNEFFKKEQPAYVLLAAAKVGGIFANNNYPADFIYNNIMIAANLIEAAYRFKVTKLLFLGSSCIYPKFAPQPIKEEYLLTGPLEMTNEPYAIAKIAGIKMCQAYNRQYGTNFISVMPTNLYGPNDNFDLKNSHVLPAIIRKFHDAKIKKLPYVEIWGTGKVRREFMHVDDLAEACIFLLNKYNDSDPINIGVGNDIAIGELAEIVKKLVGYTGKILYNNEFPEGTPQKLLDITKIKRLGYQPKISLEQGIISTYQWYIQHSSL